MKRVPGKVSTRYPAASALPTRASAAEVQLDEEPRKRNPAPTSLDPPSFPTWSAPGPRSLEVPPGPAPAPAEAAPKPSAAVRRSELAGSSPLAPAVPGAPAVFGWVALAVLGLLSGIAGALFGIWLVLGGG